MRKANIIMERRSCDSVLLERLDNLIRENKEDHGLLIAQTTKTNGRVTALEQWMNRATGAMIVVNMFIVPIIMWLVYEHLEQ